MVKQKAIQTFKAKCGKEGFMAVMLGLVHSLSGRKLKYPGTGKMAYLSPSPKKETTECDN